MSAFGGKADNQRLKRDQRPVVISAVAESDARYVVQSGGAANGEPERGTPRTCHRLLRACDGPGGLAIGNGSAGIDARQF